MRREKRLASPVSYTVPVLRIHSFFSFIHSFVFSLGGYLLRDNSTFSLYFNPPFFLPSLTDIYKDQSVHQGKVACIQSRVTRASFSPMLRYGMGYFTNGEVLQLCRKSHSSEIEFVGSNRNLFYKNIYSNNSN